MSWLFAVGCIVCNPINVCVCVWKMEGCSGTSLLRGAVCWMLIGALVQGQPQHSCVRANEHQSRPFYYTDTLSFSLQMSHKLGRKPS